MRVGLLTLVATTAHALRPSLMLLPGASTGRITEDEARGLRLLKAQVEAARGVTMPTDLRLLQFLLGRKMDVPSALKKLTKYQEVERQWALESCGLWADDTIKELQTLKMYVVPPTAGAPAVLYFHAALHLPDDFTTECTMRSFCHLIWRMLEVRRAQPGAHRSRLPA